MHQPRETLAATRERERESRRDLSDPQEKTAARTESPNKKLRHSQGAIRHVEKRRTATCCFADRVARISLDTYQACVPEWFRTKQQQTVVATILAHFQDTGELQVLSLGVGTKFLTEDKLRIEQHIGAPHGMDGCPASTDREGYGWRVRDCHAEVLARRGFRRQLGLELGSLHTKDAEREGPEGYRRILRPTRERKNTLELKSNVTLHLYSSSAPCGNATLKKFAKMRRETFDHSLGPDEWPGTTHEPIPGHSLKLGEFALLVKKSPEPSYRVVSDVPSQKGKAWPSQANDDWCPPGTSIPTFHKGSLHTCSDKICRWNCLGLQGSFISSMLITPLYLTTFTVGRKLTPITCRRAVCCRAHGYPDKCKPSKESSMINDKRYTLHHPAIMGTAVYMDEGGTFDMAAAEGEGKGKDVSFDSTLSWVWWASISEDCPTRRASQMAECIDGALGAALEYSTDHDPEHDASGRTERPSLICTAELTRQFADATGQEWSKLASPSLQELRKFKRHVAPAYEHAKDALLLRHRVFRDWKRREHSIITYKSSYHS